MFVSQMDTSVPFISFSFSWQTHFILILFPISLHSEQYIYFSPSHSFVRREGERERKWERENEKRSKNSILTFMKSILESSGLSNRKRSRKLSSKGSNWANFWGLRYIEQRIVFGREKIREREEEKRKKREEEERKKGKRRKKINYKTLIKISRI